MKDTGEINKETKDETLKHSGLGIASFIISIISGVILWGCIITSTIVEVTTIGGMSDIVAGLLGLLIIFGGFLCVIGIGLGISGVIQKNRKKVFSILGIILNFTSILIIIGLMILGSTV